MATSPFIIDTSDQTFSEEVILKSLAPVLDEVAAHFGGKVLIAKLNTDENPALSQHFQIRGIPALKLIKNREVVFETGGVQPITALIEAITPFVNTEEASVSSDGAPSDAETEQIDSQELNPAEALEQLRLVLTDNQNDPVVQSQYIQALVANDELDNAFEHFQALNKEVQDSEAGQQTKVFLDFARTRAEAPALSDLEKTLKNNPQDLTARYQLAVYKLLDDQSEAALQDFLLGSSS